MACRSQVLPITSKYRKKNLFSQTNFQYDRPTEIFCRLKQASKQTRQSKTKQKNCCTIYFVKEVCCIYVFCPLQKFFQLVDYIIYTDLHTQLFTGLFK